MSPAGQVQALVIGGGPAGLMAAEVLATQGHRVVVAEAMPVVDVVVVAPDLALDELVVAPAPPVPGSPSSQAAVADARAREPSRPAARER